MAERLTELMAHYIALIHKEPGSLYGVSFPDLPGVITAGQSIDDAMEQAAGVLAFAAEDWILHHDGGFPTPRTIDDLRRDGQFLADSGDAVVAAVPLRRSVAEPA